MEFWFVATVGGASSRVDSDNAAGSRGLGRLSNLQICVEIKSVRQDVVGRHSGDRALATGNSELISDGENGACHNGERFMVMHGGCPIEFVAPERRSMEPDAKEKCSLWTP